MGPGAGSSCGAGRGGDFGAAGGGAAEGLAVSHSAAFCDPASPVPPVAFTFALTLIEIDEAASAISAAVVDWVPDENPMRRLES